VKVKKRIIDVAAEAVKCFERDDQKVAKKVAADEMKTKVVTKKMDSDKRKQKKSTKKELVKAESTEVAPNRVVHEKCAEEKVGKKASPTLVKKDKIGSAEKINTGKVNVEPKNIREVDAKPVPGVGSPPEGEARLPAPLTEEELLSVCWRWTVGLRTYLENLANFLASFQDIRMEEGNLLTFEFPFRGLLERTLAALATEETGSVAKLRQGKQQVRLGLAADCLPRWCWSRSGLRTHVRPGAAGGARPRARGGRGGRAGGGPRLVGLQAGLPQGAHRPLPAARAARPAEQPQLPVPADEAASGPGPRRPRLPHGHHARWQCLPRGGADLQPRLEIGQDRQVRRPDDGSRTWLPRFVEVTVGRNGLTVAFACLPDLQAALGKFCGPARRHHHPSHQAGPRPHLLARACHHQHGGWRGPAGARAGAAGQANVNHFNFIRSCPRFPFIIA
jgi:hypothetical protein